MAKEADHIWGRDGIKGAHNTIQGDVGFKKPEKKINTQTTTTGELYGRWTRILQEQNNSQNPEDGRIKKCVRQTDDRNVGAQQSWNETEHRSSEVFTSNAVRQLKFKYNKKQPEWMCVPFSLFPFSTSSSSSSVQCLNCERERQSKWWGEAFRKCAHHWRPKENGREKKESERRAITLKTLWRPTGYPTKKPEVVWKRAKEREIVWVRVFF